MDLGSVLAMTSGFAALGVGVWKSAHNRTPRPDRPDEEVVVRRRSAASDAIDRSKSAILRQKEELRAAVEAGKQAYRESETSPASPNVD